MNTSTRRAIFLDECGVGPLWVRRHAEIVQLVTQPEVLIAEIANAPVGTIVALAPAILKAEFVDNVAIILTPALALPAAQAPGAQAEADDLMSAWEETSLPISTAPTTFDPLQQIPQNIATDSDTVLADIAGMDWRQLKAAVSECTRCGLCHGRAHTVFGVGDERAKWLFIGEGPGQSEDQVGEPFVGPAGKLLDNMLLAIGVKRGENAYIANIVKCRPTNDEGHDRSPSAEEIAACLPHLQRQIALIEPTVLVALGKTAALALLALDPSTLVASLRGTIHRYAGLPLVVTYHPAYLLRKPADKAKVWSDLCLATTCHAPVLE
ncbi:uracil-DNA glycosylase [Glaciimonas sp. CA11.2]|uniref:uracil-DNA glycosylase n=1 Tax=Glaciimonas sp. CA11.2 TaxID=3048601 RepID=UPI002AB3FCBC|nr:uracil-DNA glycosylase [Glaciimonas sp. CA11.2]MDY7547862.1 uracil-DNA glycosylase [Glaciimonas sp. CA11.2]